MEALIPDKSPQAEPSPRAGSDEEKSSWEFSQGDEIVPGRYALQPLGGGTLCETYLAWDDQLFCLVVVKLVRPALVGDAGTERRLRREARALNSLAHPMVLRCFETAVEGDRPHIVEEYVEGAPLSKYVRQTRLQLDQLLPLFTRLSSALHYLAGREMLHLDVKPANIVVGANARLIDFSLARSTSRAARVKSSIGTDAYMAPEQCDPQRLGPLGPPADIFGLGASLYHALAGHTPFRRGSDSDSEDTEARFPQLTSRARPVPEGLPDALSSLLERCLAAEPQERPTASELALGFERLIVS